MIPLLLFYDYYYQQRNNEYILQLIYFQILLICKIIVKHYKSIFNYMFTLKKFNYMSLPYFKTISYL